MQVALAALLSGALFACHAKSGPTVISNHSEATENVGQHVDIEGRAGNAKLGAIVETQTGFVVYCQGLESWPEAIVGKIVLAHGTLRESSDFIAKPGPNGEQSQGTSGPIWILENCTYNYPHWIATSDK